MDLVRMCLADRHKSVPFAVLLQACSLLDRIRAGFSHALILGNYAARRFCRE